MNRLGIKKEAFKAALKETDFVLRYTILLNKTELFWNAIRGEKYNLKLDDPNRKTWERRTNDIDFDWHHPIIKLNAQMPCTEEFAPWDVPKEGFGLLKTMLLYKGERLDPKSRRIMPVKEDFFTISDSAFCILSAYDAVTSYLSDDCWSEFNTPKKEYIEYAKTLSKFNSHKKIFKQLGMEYIFDIQDACVNQKQFTLFFNLMQIEGRRLSTALKMYRNDDEMKSSGEIRTSWRTLVEIYENLKEKAPIDDVEKILYLYQLESVFHVDLINHLMGSILELRKNNKPYPDGENEIKSLAKFSGMQNIFFRGIYAQYVLNFLTSKEVADSLSDFQTGSKHTIFEWGAEVSKWLDKCQKYYYPMAQWDMIISVLEAVGAIDAEGNLIEENLPVAEQNLKEYINLMLDDYKEPLKRSKLNGLDIGNEYLLYSGLKYVEGTARPQYNYYGTEDALKKVERKRDIDLEPERDLRTIYTITREINKNSDKHWPLSCPEFSRVTVLKFRNND